MRTYYAFIIKDSLMHFYSKKPYSLYKILEQYKEKRIAVISHGGSIKFLLLIKSKAPEMGLFLLFLL